MADKQPEYVRMVCNTETFCPCYTAEVRWLDWDMDFEMAREAWAVHGIALAKELWLDFRDSGYTYCGVIADGKIVSSAAVFTRIETEWEAAAVWTLEGYRKLGYGKSVVSFVTQNILDAGRLATCHTGADNIAMQSTACSVGYLR